MKKKFIFAAIVPMALSLSGYAQMQQTTSDNYSASPRLKMGNQILAISPMQFTENGVGFSFSYEKGIDKDGIIAYNLPIISTFNLSNNADNGGHQDAMFYLSPGIKFYPTGSYGKVKYAIGPSLVLGAGEKTTGYTDQHYDTTTRSYTYTTTSTTRSKFLLGIMVDNSINLNPTPHFYLGLNFGFGFTYINTLNGANQGVNGIVQGGFKIGYRF